MGRSKTIEEGGSGERSAHDHTAPTSAQPQAYHFGLLFTYSFILLLDELVFVVFVFELGSGYVVQVSLSEIHLAQPPECLDYQYAEQPASSLRCLSHIFPVLAGGNRAEGTEGQVLCPHQSYKQLEKTDKKCVTKLRHEKL